MPTSSLLCHDFALRSSDGAQACALPDCLGLCMADYRAHSSRGLVERPVQQPPAHAAPQAPSTDGDNADPVDEAVYDAETAAERRTEIGRTTAAVSRTTGKCNAACFALFVVVFLSIAGASFDRGEAVIGGVTLAVALLSAYGLALYAEPLLCTDAWRGRQAVRRIRLFKAVRRAAAQRDQPAPAAAAALAAAQADAERHTLAAAEAVDLGVLRAASEDAAAAGARPGSARAGRSGICSRASAMPWVPLLSQPVRLARALLLDSATQGAVTTAAEAIAAAAAVDAREAAEASAAAATSLTAHHAMLRLLTASSAPPTAAHPQLQQQRRQQEAADTAAGSQSFGTFAVTNPLSTGRHASLQNSPRMMRPK
jgi:hypothetical protein